MYNYLSPTELASTEHKPIDKVTDKEALQILLNSQRGAVEVVFENIDKIKNFVDKIFNHLKFTEYGRLIYVGAGTSGRVAVQDGVELYPTFGWPKARFDFIIAGGKRALTSSVENAEDDLVKANSSIDKLKVNKYDVVIGLAASGNTPFTTQVLKISEKLGALTIGISNNPNSVMTNNINNCIILDTGPEVVEGSTRLKAGTSQKICLNLITTLLMTKFGKIIEGKMKNLVATNKKLRDRKKRIESFLNK